MNVGKYSFEEFKDLVTSFHSYPAPGVLIGGYMVEMAKAALPDGTLFEALVETKKCLPDSVQLLTLCSTGNNWMKVVHHGKYALSLYDKYSGKGFRVSLNTDKMQKYPEIFAWFMRYKKKQDQDTDLLFKEIEEAGHNICDIQPIKIIDKFLGHEHSKAHLLCDKCGEAYPDNGSTLCSGCLGDVLFSYDVAPD